MKRKPGRRNSPLYVQSLYGAYTKNIHVSHDRRADNSYIVTFKDQIVRRIYMTKDGTWYIWYEQLGFRRRVKNFTEAINIVEEELKRCVA